MLGLLLLPEFAAAQSLSSLDDYIAKALQNWEVPGLSVAIVRNDSVIYAKGFGVKEVGKSDRVTEHTIFAIGSATKPFTAAVVAQLVDDGKLRWDDRVQRHLSGFQVLDPYVSHELSIRDLLSHRTGLERGDPLWYGTDFGRDEILRRARYLEQERGFREAFTYNNIMYLAAGEVAAKVAGKSWDDLIQERIFTPLGMRRSSTTIPTLTDVATPHARLDNRVTTVPRRNNDNIGPAGSINSDAVDMTRLVRLFLNNGSFEGKQLIKPASVRAMHSANIVMSSSLRTDSLMPETHFRAYGLGWFLQDYRGRKIVSHGGNTTGMTSLLWLVPEEKLGLVILANRMNVPDLPTALAYRITDLLTGGARRDWSTEYLASMRVTQAQFAQSDEQEQRTRALGTNPSLVLEKYAGTYEHRMHGPVTVEVRDGKLIIRRGAHVEGPLTHWHYDVFRAAWSDRLLGNPFVTFLIDPQARVQSLRVEELGEFARRR
jgi:CubicO group peptidase (beta-lactamase class C family)